MSNKSGRHLHRFDEDGFCKCGKSIEPECPVCNDRGCSACDDTDRTVPAWMWDEPPAPDAATVNKYGRPLNG